MFLEQMNEFCHLATMICIQVFLSRLFTHLQHVPPTLLGPALNIYNTHDLNQFEQKTSFILLIS